jgi:hypothetical protein
MLCAETGADFFLFLDDFHYLEMVEQPAFLDMLHGITRDTSAWIKLAAIRNQCRLFDTDTILGMQIGHDVAPISLDITLEEPKKARSFLGGILQTYLKSAGITVSPPAYVSGVQPSNDAWERVGL